MMKAYEFALDKVGIDVASGNIWSDYVNFIKVRYDNHVNQTSQSEHV